MKKFVTLLLLIANIVLCFGKDSDTSYGIVPPHLASHARRNPHTLSLINPYLCD
jgi:hypothetical protein